MLDSTRDVDQFLGLWSTTAFARTRFETNIVSLAVALDDLMFGLTSSRVPEPGTLSLLSLGLLGLGYTARRRLQ